MRCSRSASLVPSRKEDGRDEVPAMPMVSESDSSRLIDLSYRDLRGSVDLKTLQGLKGSLDAVVLAHNCIEAVSFEPDGPDVPGKIEQKELAIVPSIKCVDLSYNQIGSIGSLKGLDALRGSMRALCLVGNPIASIPTYRSDIAARFPWISTLDGIPLLRKAENVSENCRMSSNCEDVSRAKNEDLEYSHTERVRESESAGLAAPSKGLIDASIHTFGQRSKELEWEEAALGKLVMEQESVVGKAPVCEGLNKAFLLALTDKWRRKVFELMVQLEARRWEALETARVYECGRASLTAEVNSLRSRLGDLSTERSRNLELVQSTRFELDTEKEKVEAARVDRCLITKKILNGFESIFTANNERNALIHSKLDKHDDRIGKLTTKLRSVQEIALERRNWLTSYKEQITELRHDLSRERATVEASRSETKRSRLELQNSQHMYRSAMNDIVYLQHELAVTREDWKRNEYELQQSAEFHRLQEERTLVVNAQLMKELEISKREAANLRHQLDFLEEKQKNEEIFSRDTLLNIIAQRDGVTTINDTQHGIKDMQRLHHDGKNPFVHSANELVTCQEPESLNAKFHYSPTEKLSRGGEHDHKKQENNLTELVSALLAEVNEVSDQSDEDDRVLDKLLESGRQSTRP